jgi:AcrR family transcriptional regulator
VRSRAANATQLRRRRSELSEQRRASILEAAEAVICEQGVQSVSVGVVVAAARVSRRSFHEAFTDLDDCLFAVFDAISARLASDAAVACGKHTRWVDGVRAGLLVVLDFLQTSPQRARFLVGASLAGDSAMLARRNHLLAELAQALEARRPPPPGDALPPPFGAEAVIAAAASIIHARLLEEPLPPLRELTGPLMAVLVMPCLGDEAAREELARPLRTPPSSQRRS